MAPAARLMVQGKGFQGVFPRVPTEKRVERVRSVEKSGLHMRATAPQSNQNFVPAELGSRKLGLLPEEGKPLPSAHFPCSELAQRVVTTSSVPVSVFCTSLAPTVSVALSVTVSVLCTFLDFLWPLKPSWALRRATPALHCRCGYYSRCPCQVTPCTYT